MIKYCCQLALIVILTLIPACSNMLPITERPCKQNITVLNDKDTGQISIISGTVTLLDKDGDSDTSLSLYFQKSDNMYLVSFINSSFGSTPPGLENAILEFADGTVLKLENLAYNKEMNEASSSKYTDTFFETSEKDLKTLSEKLLEKISISFPPANKTQALSIELNTEKAATIKYLANCFIMSAF
jgi:hypothetical protein